MVSEDNPGYFFVGEQNRPLSQSQKQSEDSYDFVTLPSGPRPGANQHQSIYEVPPLSFRGKGNGQEGDDTPNQVPSRASRGQSFDLYENTSIGNQQQINQPTEYDFVTLPPRKATMEQSSYDVVPAPSRVSQDERSSQEVDTSATGGRGQAEQPCPLDAPGYEFVQLRKPSSFTGDSTPEMQPFAPLAGYEPMAPPHDEGYEMLAPSADIHQQLSSRGDYETLAMIGPQRTRSQTEAVRVTQQRTSAMNIPASASLYEVPPTMASPVYEIAPPPRNIPPVSYLQ